VGTSASAASAPPLRGLFLAFEGVEGAGKSTHVSLLAEFFRRQEREVIVAREPGSTLLGERIRETTLGDPDLLIPAASELFLMLAARAAFVEQIVRPALQRGCVVIADRFELSTLAYQGAGRGLDRERIRACNHFATGGVAPDATVLLEVVPEVGVARQQVAGKRFDRMEREDRQFHARVARGYSQLAGEVPGVVRVDGAGSVEQVHRRVVEALEAGILRNFSQQAG
jgi:dTMP kinase